MQAAEQPCPLDGGWAGQQQAWGPAEQGWHQAGQEAAAESRYTDSQIDGALRDAEALLGLEGGAGGGAGSWQPCAPPPQLPQQQPEAGGAGWAAEGGGKSPRPRPPSAFSLNEQVRACCALHGMERGLVLSPGRDAQTQGQAGMPWTCTRRAPLAVSRAADARADLG